MNAETHVKNALASRSDADLLALWRDLLAAQCPSGDEQHLLRAVEQAVTHRFGIAQDMEAWSRDHPAASRHAQVARMCVAIAGALSRRERSAASSLQR